MVFREHTPDRRLGSDGLPITVLQEGYVVKNAYTVKYLTTGGTGVIYRGEAKKKRFILKEVDGKDPNAVILLNQEKATLDHLDHPGIVKAEEIFEERGYFYLVLEFIDGETLMKKLPRSTTVFLSEKVVLDWANQLFNIFEYLHSQKPPIIYRDLKPQNIMLNSSGEIKLIDFGIARLYKQRREEDTIKMGSVITASPEHYGEGQTDVRSDIYTLGATLYFLLTNGMAKREQIFKFPLLRSINPKVSEKTEKVIAKSLDIKPEDRYQCVADMREALLGTKPTQGGIPCALPYLLHSRKSSEMQAPPESEDTTRNLREVTTPLKLEKPERLHCPKCGEKNQEDSRFCEFCGAPLKGEKGPPETSKAGAKASGRTATSLKYIKPGVEQEPTVVLKKSVDNKPPANSSPGPSKQLSKKTSRFDRNKIVVPLIILVVLAIGFLSILLVGMTISKFILPRVAKSPSPAKASLAANPTKAPPFSPSQEAHPLTPSTSPTEMASPDSRTIPAPSPTRSAAISTSPSATKSADISPSPQNRSPVIIAGGTSHGELEVEKLMKSAIDSFDRHEYAHAGDTLHEILKLDPKYLEAYWYLGQCRERAGEKDQALKAYKQYIKKLPKNPDRLRHMASLFVDAGDYKKAIALEKAAQKLLKTLEGYYDLGYYYYLAQEYDNAIPPLKSALKMQENHYLSLELLALCYRKSGKKGDAIGAYKRMYEMSPDKYQLLYDIGFLAYETGDYGTAKEYLKRYLKWENDPQATSNAQALLKKAKINALRKIPPAVERNRDFITGVSVIGILKYGNKYTAHLDIQGSAEEVSEGQTVLDRYYVLSIKEERIVFADDEQYVVLRP